MDPCSEIFGLSMLKGPESDGPARPGNGLQPVAAAQAGISLEFAGTEDHVLLIVDDAETNLTLLHELLAPQYRVLAATNGPRALEIARRMPQPDLILLDIMMPGMDGHEVLARLRADPLTRDIPVIFISAAGDSEAEEDGIDLGAGDFIHKPFRARNVLARVRLQLELKRAREVLTNQNACLEAEIARRLADNEHSQDVAIHALARLAEMRDPETGHHTRRTQEYVRALATALYATGRYDGELDARAIAAISKSAPLHDIGKVAIPDAILQKPGALTPAEMEVMRTHAHRGRLAIEAAERDAEEHSDFLRYAKEIVGCHHECWNGTGYPAGLKGEEIPLAARLMALADVFDALTTPRVYKKPWPVEAARDQIVSESGQRFDPAVVTAFLAVFDDFVAIRARLCDEPQD